MSDKKPWILEAGNAIESELHNMSIALGALAATDVVQNDGHFTLEDIKWMDRSDFPLVVKIILFENGKPSRYLPKTFVGSECDKFIDYLAGISLTHRIMFVRNGYIFVTESEDHQTNINDLVIDEFLKLYKRVYPEEKRMVRYGQI
jgi:hypothetical protein